MTPRYRLASIALRFSAMNSIEEIIQHRGNKVYGIGADFGVRGNSRIAKLIKHQILSG